MSYQMSNPVKLKLLSDFELILYFIERIDREPIVRNPDLDLTFHLLRVECLEMIEKLKGDLE